MSLSSIQICNGNVITTDNKLNKELEVYGFDRKLNPIQKSALILALSADDKEVSWIKEKGFGWLNVDDFEYVSRSDFNVLLLLANKLLYHKYCENGIGSEDDDSLGLIKPIQEYIENEYQTDLDKDRLTMLIGGFSGFKGLIYTVMFDNDICTRKSWLSNQSLIGNMLELMLKSEKVRNNVCFVKTFANTRGYIDNLGIRLHNPELEYEINNSSLTKAEKVRLKITIAAVMDPFEDKTLKGYVKGIGLPSTSSIEDIYLNIGKLEEKPGLCNSWDKLNKHIFKDDCKKLFGKEPESNSMNSNEVIGQLYKDMKAGLFKVDNDTVTDYLEKILF